MLPPLPLSLQLRSLTPPPPEVLDRMNGETPCGSPWRTARRSRIWCSPPWESGNKPSVPIAGPKSWWAAKACRALGDGERRPH